MAQILQGLNQVVYLPSGGPEAANDATAKNVPGTVITYNGVKYMYVQFDNGSGNVAAVDGGAVHWKTLDPAAGSFVVTSDYTDAIATVNTGAGILGCVVTDQYYCWIQITGPVTALVNASTVKSDMITLGSTDLTFERIAAGQALTNRLYGIALTAYNGSTGTASVLLQNLDWGK